MIKFAYSPSLCEYQPESSPSFLGPKRVNSPGSLCYRGSFSVPSHLPKLRDVVSLHNIAFHLQYIVGKSTSFLR
jgi:hypothetical protein